MLSEKYLLFVLLQSTRSLLLVETSIPGSLIGLSFLLNHGVDSFVPLDESPL